MSDRSACTYLRSCKVHFLLTATENTFLPVQHRGMLLHLNTLHYCRAEHRSQHFFYVLSSLKPVQPQSFQGWLCSIQGFRERVTVKISFPVVANVKILMKYLQNNRWFSLVDFTIRVGVTIFLLSLLKLSTNINWKPRCTKIIQILFSQIWTRNTEINDLKITHKQDWFSAG